MSARFDAAQWSSKPLTRETNDSTKPIVGFLNLFFDTCKFCVGLIRSKPLQKATECPEGGSIWDWGERVCFEDGIKGFKTMVK